MTLQHPRSVFQLMKAHYSRYTPEVVSSITGIPVADFEKVADLVGQMGKPDKVMTIVYAVGLTHHTTGGQLIRSGAVLQLLLGNMGRPGDRKSTRLNSSHSQISYAVFCLKKKKKMTNEGREQLASAHPACAAL